MQIDFEDRGSGPTLLFLPGSYSTKDAWRGILGSLRGSYRTITTSLPGYGGTDEVRDGNVSDMTEMLDFVVRVSEEIGEPFHIIGHSFGGQTAMAATLFGAVTPLSMITFEGNPIYSIPNQGTFSWRQGVLELMDEFKRAIANEEQDAAALIIDFWGVPGFFASMPEAVQEFCRSTAYTNLLDWQSASGFNPEISDFAKISIPSTLVRGELANEAIVEITGLITAAMPDAGEKIVEGAGHFLISTHSKQCAEIIDQHMAAFYRGKER